MVPYSGRLGGIVTLFEPGHVRVELRERRAVRNHLGSIHAVALVNLGELASGLAVMGGLPATVRGIVTGLDVTFSKKARGRVVAESRCGVPPEVPASTPVDVEATIRDASGELVARVVAHWLLGPVPASAAQGADTTS
jgi:acyl-coenzyme A thioesterase PaaI-like protein